MKSQYFGDINDYRKYGLLRILTNGGEIKTAVCWMLTLDDNCSGGRFVCSPEQPVAWMLISRPCREQTPRLE